MDDFTEYYFSGVDRLLESKHEKIGGSCDTEIEIAGISIWMDNFDKKALAKPVKIHKTLMDDGTALIIGDFQLPWAEKPCIQRFLLIGFKNKGGKYQLAIKHELYSDYS